MQRPILLAFLLGVLVCVPPAPAKAADPPTEKKKDPSRLKDRPKGDGYTPAPGLILDTKQIEWPLQASLSRKLLPPFTQELRIAFTFTDDMPDIAEVKRAFQTSPDSLDKQPLIWVFVDKEGASLARYAPSRIEGDITGKKGDTFRLYLKCETETVQKARKLEARINKKDK